LTREFALIGNPLGHSFSAAYFNDRFGREGLSDCRYISVPLLSADKIPVWIASVPGLQGFNVTVPYKEEIIPYLDDLSPEAREIGAVNTVTVIRQGNKIILKGYNTDAGGFDTTLEKPFPHSRALVLGTGGAAKAVASVMKKRGLAVTFATRRKSGPDRVSYPEIDRKLIESHTFIVNCTPLGMSPCTHECPDIPYEFIGKAHYCYDLIYNPVVSLFLEKSGRMGARTKNGLDMLYNQASLAFDIWFPNR
jgi:shikimate dehydrogenase